MSEREKRKQRKEWKERTKKSRENKKKVLLAIKNIPSPPYSPQSELSNDNNLIPEPGKSRKTTGEKLSRKNKQKLKKNLQVRDIK